jgi:ribose/xylose/arabinose/galactoside ABC-type transport system permease subunit
MYPSLDSTVACLVRYAVNILFHLFYVNTYWQTAVSGFVVLIAISFDSVGTIADEFQARRKVLAKRK